MSFIPLICRCDLVHLMYEGMSCVEVTRQWQLQRTHHPNFRLEWKVYWPPTTQTQCVCFSLRTSLHRRSNKWCSTRRRSSTSHRHCFPSRVEQQKQTGKQRTNKREISGYAFSLPTTLPEYSLPHHDFASIISRAHRSEQNVCKNERLHQNKCHQYKSLHWWKHGKNPTWYNEQKEGWLDRFPLQQLWHLSPCQGNRKKSLLLLKPRRQWIGQTSPNLTRVKIKLETNYLLNDSS